MHGELCSDGIAVLGHCEHRGSEVLLGDQAHIFLYEQAGMAQVSALHCLLCHKTVFIIY